MSVSPNLWIYLCIGLAAGVLSGMFGIGGGIVIVPALVLLANFPTKTALGTSLGALLLPVGLLGAYAYWENGNLDVRVSTGTSVHESGGERPSPSQLWMVGIGWPSRKAVLASFMRIRPRARGGRPTP